MNFLKAKESFFDGIISGIGTWIISTFLDWLGAYMYDKFSITNMALELGGHIIFMGVFSVALFFAIEFFGKRGIFSYRKNTPKKYISSDNLESITNQLEKAIEEFKHCNKDFENLTKQSKIKSIKDLISKLDNLFSEDSIRELYIKYGFGEFYHKYQENLKNAMSESLGIFEGSHALNVLLKKLHNGLNAIEENDPLDTVSSGNIEMVLKVKNALMDEFRNVKTELISITHDL